MPKFWRVPLPGEQFNPESRQDIYLFPDSCTVFWSNHTPRVTPFQTLLSNVRMWLSITLRVYVS